MEGDDVIRYCKIVRGGAAARAQKKKEDGRDW